MGVSRHQFDAKLKKQQAQKTKKMCALKRISRGFKALIVPKNMKKLNSQTDRTDIRRPFHYIYV